MEEIKRDYAAERKEAAIKLIEDFSNIVNGSPDVEQILESFSRQHRTLQQSMFGVMMQIVCFIAKDEYRTDPRNEYTKKLAKDLIAGYLEQFKKNEAETLMGIGYSKEKAEERAEEYKQMYIKTPEKLMATPCI